MPLGKKGKFDPLDVALQKLGGYRANPGERIPEEIKTRLQEKFPYHHKALQVGWVIRQLEGLKDVFLDTAHTPKNLNMKPLIQYRATLVTIRDTIYLRDNGEKRKGLKPPKNPLKGMLTEDQEAQIEKAREKARENGNTGSVDRGSD